MKMKKSQKKSNLFTALNEVNYQIDVLINGGYNQGLGRTWPRRSRSRAMTTAGLC